MKLDEIDTLYHGTGIYFEDIDLNYSDSSKDFGRGFYLTSHWQQAASLARRRNPKECWIFGYALSPDYRNMKIKEFLDYDEEWLKFITKHRIRGEDTPFDIVYDRMADNKGNVLAQALQEYADGHASAQRTLDIIRFYQSHRDQYCFKTQSAIGLLKRIYTYRFGDGKWKEEPV